VVKRACLQWCMVAAPSTSITAYELTSKQKLRVLWLLWALFFLLLLITEVQDHWGMPGVRWWEPGVWMGSSALVATLWLWAYLRDREKAAAYLNRPALWLWRQIRWFPLVAVVFVCLTYGLRHGFYALVGLQYKHESWPFVFLYESIKLWLFLGLWLGILFALESFDHWQRQQRHLAELQRSLAQAQLLQLKTQLRPHFLFNALNTISSLMQVDVARADRLLNQLAHLLRANLRSDQQELTSLSAEIDLLKMYSRIMEERFEDRVSVRWDIDVQAQEGSIPTMLLQPLLENAFKHGVENTGSHTDILVNAKRLDGDLELRIINLGEVSPAKGEGMGLKNIRARLELHYGPAASLEFKCDASGAEARVLIPWLERSS
jgi:two-component system, LytTR family, sensor kinase